MSVLRKIIITILVLVYIFVFAVDFNLDLKKTKLIVTNKAKIDSLTNVIGILKVEIEYKDSLLIDKAIDNSLTKYHLTLPQNVK